MDILIQWFEKSLVSKFSLNTNNTNLVRQQAKHASDRDFTSQIKKSQEVFNTWYSWSDSSPLYTMALVLHPYRCTKYIEANWKKQWVKPALKKVRQLWEEYRDKVLTSTVIISSYDRPSQSTQGIKPEQELDAFDQIAKNLGNYTRPASQDEFQNYCTRDLYDIGKMSALEWWCQDP